MSLREREIATVALLTALWGRESQLHSHMEAAVHVGITLQERGRNRSANRSVCGISYGDQCDEETRSSQGRRKPLREGVIMNTTIPKTSRTAHLLALMKKGDDAFNARDFAAMDAVHHPDMIAHITGNAEPIYGRASARRDDEADVPHLPRRPRGQRSLPNPVRKRRLDHRGHPQHKDLQRGDDPARRQGDCPDRKSIRCRVCPDHQVGWRPDHRNRRLLERRSAGAADRPRRIGVSISKREKQMVSNGVASEANLSH